MNRSTLQRNAIPPLLIVLLAIVFSFVNPAFANRANLFNILRELSVTLILTVGLTLVVLTGSLDLSYAGIVSLSSVLIAIYLPVLGISSSVLGPIAGAFVGFANGVIFVKGKVSSFVVTLGMYILLGGVALLISGGFVHQTSQPAFIAIADASPLLVPNMFLWALVITILSIFLSFGTTFGRSLYAIGLNTDASKIAGLRIGMTRIIVFTLSGLFAGIGGLLITANAGAGYASIGNSLLLPVFAATFIGGTSITGGIGGPHRAILGALILTILADGLSLMDINPNTQSIIIGVVVLLSITLSLDRSKLRTIS